MRLPAVIGALVISLLTGTAGIAPASVPSTVSHQLATPLPDSCVVTGPIAQDSWNLPAFDTQIADGSMDESSAACHFDPGVNVESHEHSGWFLLYVESGQISFTISEGIMWSHCAARCVPNGPIGPDGIETLVRPTMVLLNAGDWVLQDRATTHSFIAGSGGASLLTAFGASPLNGDGGCQGAC